MRHSKNTRCHLKLHLLATRSVSRTTGIDKYSTVLFSQSEVKSLQERVEQSDNELAEVRARSNESQKRFEAERTSWINDKKTLEDTIVDLSSSEKQTESDRNSREQEMRVLDERVKVRETLIQFLLFTQKAIRAERRAEIFSGDYRPCGIHEGLRNFEEGSCSFSSFRS